MTGKIQIKNVTNLGTNVSESMTINPEIAKNILSDDSDTALAAATLLDTFARGIIGCTNNTYNDTIVTLMKQTKDHAED